MKRVRVLDFESTGFPEDGGLICQVGTCDLIGEGKSWSVCVPRAKLCSPGAPIPSTASAIHHITDGDVYGLPEFDPADLFSIDDDGPPISYLAAHNLKAERGFLKNHMERGLKIEWPTIEGGICTYKGSMRLFPEAPGHSNQALRYELKLDVPREMRGHGAGDDAFVTARILQRLLQDASLEDLAKWATQPVLQVTCRIGVWRNSRWEHVDSSFMEWILSKDFDEDVVFTCRYWLDRRERERDAERAAEREAAGEPADPVDKVVSAAELEARGQTKLL